MQTFLLDAYAPLNVIGNVFPGDLAAGGCDQRLGSSSKLSQRS